MLPSAQIISPPFADFVPVRRSPACRAGVFSLLDTEPDVSHEGPLTMDYAIQVAQTELTYTEMGEVPLFEYVQPLVGNRCVGAAWLLDYDLQDHQSNLGR